MDEHDVKVAIQEIMLDRKAYSTSLNYAIGYCREALNMSGNDLKVQCLYILNNIKSWRAPRAKEIRELLKAFTKVDRRKSTIYGRRVR